MTSPIFTRDQAKARAREIRAERRAADSSISHAAALEAVAAEQGCGDWNTLSARLSNLPEVPLQVGDFVEGRYLRQPFTGTVVAVHSLGDGRAFEVSIDLDEPVDVVAFDSFSNMRRRVNATISPGGVSPSRTTDGVPHLVVARAAGARD